MPRVIFRFRNGNKRRIVRHHIRKTDGMDRPHLPLNALRAFEASARQGSFTRAATELCVTQAAISQHVKGLEDRLQTTLFRRTSRGLALTEEGAALLPVVTRSFDGISEVLDRFLDGRFRTVVTLGVVTTFALGWLLPRLPAFHAAHPEIDLRLSTNHNRVDLAGEGLDMAIRFGDGDWRWEECLMLLEAPLTPLCNAATSARLDSPGDLLREPLLRSFRALEWERWFNGEGIVAPKLTGPQFDSSPALAMAAAAGLGVALLPARMFSRDLADGRLVQPFASDVQAGAYWLCRLKSRELTPAMLAVQQWLVADAASEVLDEPVRKRHEQDVAPRA